MPRTLEQADLKAAYDGSWYFIAGCGGDLDEWTKGYDDLLTEAGIGKPTAWYVTTGADVNTFAQETDDPFPNTLQCLLFPLDGLNVPALAMFRLRMQDRWFDDVVQNMRG